MAHRDVVLGAQVSGSVSMSAMKSEPWTNPRSKVSSFGAGSHWYKIDFGQQEQHPFTKRRVNYKITQDSIAPPELSTPLPTRRV